MTLEKGVKYYFFLMLKPVAFLLLKLSVYGFICQSIDAHTFTLFYNLFNYTSIFHFYVYEGKPYVFFYLQ